MAPPDSAFRDTPSMLAAASACVTFINFQREFESSQS